MKRFGIALLLVIVGAAAVLISQSTFIVHQTKQALVLQLGEIVRVVRSPGLGFKLPFVQSVVYLDKRILDLDAPAKPVFAIGREQLVVDAFARFRIKNPQHFYERLKTLENAEQQLSIQLNSVLINVVAAAQFDDVISGRRSDLMIKMRDLMNQQAQGKRFGVEVIDVKIKRADLPAENTENIIQRMKTERQREAAEIRAKGEEEKLKIISRADRDATVIKAQAQREAEILRGQGDAEKNKIFAEAFGKDPDFFAFYRSMKAYETALRSGETTMILSPDSEFFKYFGDSMGK